MIPTSRQREALDAAVISPEARRAVESRIAHEEHQMASTIKTVRSESFARSVDRAARVHAAMAEDEQRVREIKARRDPSDAAELRRIRERQTAYRKAIDEFERATEETARIAADPVAHANELLAKYPSLGGV